MVKSDQMAPISENLADIEHRIVEAALRSGRQPDEIKLVAVSKTQPASIIREAMNVGVRVFGENKVQEGETKILDIGRNAAEWHLIGHLQSNKARKAVQLFDVIHSVDSTDLAKRLERICSEEGREELRVLVQVDLAGEDTKSGVPEAGVPEILEYLHCCTHLKLDGLMVLPPYFDDPEATRPYFRRAGRLSLEDQFRPRNHVRHVLQRNPVR